ncbi:apoptosis-antagonizing transcription factor [Lipomyces arxii]|uniref:apoptosis-antagonizing transcription factor n=1 Tax=Lipomyces arxii TaxID=56418 RepID=UPI0034CDD7F9
MEETYLNGLAVKRQTTIYERILDARIQIQKALAALNKLSTLQTEEVKTPEVQGLVHEAEDKVDILLDRIYLLRSKLMEASEIAVPEGLPRKRKRSAESQYELCSSLETACLPYRAVVLERWSRKVDSANGIGALGNNKKFSVINQSVSAQIDDQLRDMDRLVARTYINRGNALVGGTVDRVDDGSMAKSSGIFDDTDFYQVLLKDLVDKNMAASDMAGGVKWTVSKPKTKRANLDVKASKGRKLRFQVQEKIQNFMPPIPTSSWSNDQIDDLFSGLFGQKIMHVVAEGTED